MISSMITTFHISKQNNPFTFEFRILEEKSWWSFINFQFFFHLRSRITNHLRYQNLSKFFLKIIIIRHVMNQHQQLFASLVQTCLIVFHYFIKFNLEIFIIWWLWVVEILNLLFLSNINYLILVVNMYVFIYI